MKTVQKEIGVRIGATRELRKGQIFIILTSMAWGSSYVFIRWGVEFLNPFVYLFFRFLVAAVITLPFLKFVRSGGFRELFLDRRVILIGLINTVAFFCEFVGMKYTTAGIAVLLTNINIVFVVFLAYVFLGEEMGMRKNIALAGSILGIFLVALNGDMTNLQGGQFFGNLLILVSGILWAFYIILLKIVLDDRSKKYTNVNSMELTYAVTIFTMIFSLPPALFYGIVDFSSILDVATVPAFMGVLYMGLVCTTLAYFLYFEGLKRVSASVSALLLLLQIVFAVVLAFLLLGEVPTLYTVLGGSLIGASIYLVS